MYVVCVTVWVIPGFEQQFIDATRENFVETRKEPGNVRFDVLQKDDDPAQFFLYEVYQTAEDFAQHQKTSHYLRWKNTVAEWMAKSRQGVRHKSLFPEETAW